MIEILWGLSIIAFSITVIKLVYDSQKNKQVKKDLMEETNIICKDIKAILNDVDMDDDSEEIYEVDASLRSYFEDKGQQIQQVIIKLQDVRIGFFAKKDKKMIEWSTLLSWITNDLYRYNYDESERIRILSKNIPEFHTKMTKILSTEL